MGGQGALGFEEKVATSACPWKLMLSIDGMAAASRLEDSGRAEVDCTEATSSRVKYPHQLPQEMNTQNNRFSPPSLGIDFLRGLVPVPNSSERCIDRP